MKVADSSNWEGVEPTTVKTVGARIDALVERSKRLNEIEEAWEGLGIRRSTTNLDEAIAATKRLISERDAIALALKLTQERNDHFAALANGALAERDEAKRDRDAAIARAEKAERERDEARDEAKRWECHATDRAAERDQSQASWVREVASLQRERDAVLRRAEEAEAKLEVLIVDQTLTLRERDRARAVAKLVTAKAGDVWFWQGGGDHPESLVPACPVVMSAETLREMLARAEAAEAKLLSVTHRSVDDLTALTESARLAVVAAEKRAEAAEALLYLETPDPPSPRVREVVDRHMARLRDVDTRLALAEAVVSAARTLRQPHTGRSHLYAADCETCNAGERLDDALETYDNYVAKVET